jgi:hypothetical protein
MATDTIVVDVTDTFVLRDDRNGHCVVVRRMCGSTMGTYWWRKANGSTVSGPVTITLMGTQASVQSKPEDVNLFQAGTDFSRSTGTARLVQTRLRPTQVSSITDTNIHNSTGACP